jgi:hypothetical protein
VIFGPNFCDFLLSGNTISNIIINRMTKKKGLKGLSPEMKAHTVKSVIVLTVRSLMVFEYLIALWVKYEMPSFFSLQITYLFYNVILSRVLKQPF